MRTKNSSKISGMFENANAKIFENAKNLRGNMTAAEMALWLHLRKGLNGGKFRRQHPIGKYVADFYCHKAKLVIEVDGSIHNDPEIALMDKDRENDLRAWGYFIIRFSNDQIFQSIEKVLQEISRNVPD